MICGGGRRGASAGTLTRRCKKLSVDRYFASDPSKRLMALQTRSLRCIIPQKAAENSSMAVSSNATDNRSPKAYIITQDDPKRVHKVPKRSHVPHVPNQPKMILFIIAWIERTLKKLPRHFDPFEHVPKLGFHVFKRLEPIR